MLSECQLQEQMSLALVSVEAGICPFVYASLDKEKNIKGIFASNLDQEDVISRVKILDTQDQYSSLDLESLQESLEHDPVSMLYNRIFLALSWAHLIPQYNGRTGQYHRV